MSARTPQELILEYRARIDWLQKALKYRTERNELLKEAMNGFDGLLLKPNYVISEDVKDLEDVNKALRMKLKIKDNEVAHLKSVIKSYGESSLS